MALMYKQADAKMRYIAGCHIHAASGCMLTTATGMLKGAQNTSRTAHLNTNSRGHKLDGEQPASSTLDWTAANASYAYAADACKPRWLLLSQPSEGGVLLIGSGLEQAPACGLVLHQPARQGAIPAGRPARAQRHRGQALRLRWAAAAPPPRVCPDTASPCTGSSSAPSYCMQGTGGGSSRRCPLSPSAPCQHKASTVTVTPAANAHALTLPSSRTMLPPDPAAACTAASMFSGTRM